MQTWLIGRGDDCDLQVNAADVSFHHCRLTLNGNRYVLEDIGSSNGTFVNGQRISKPTTVARSDQILLSQLVPMPWPKAQRPALPVATQMQTRQISIGRDPDSDFVVDQPNVSWNHARLTVSGQTYTLEDLGSSNGTYVGSLDNRIEKTDISPDDVIFLGSYRLPARQLLEGNDHGDKPSNIDLPVSDRPIVLGRDPQCDRVLDHPLISWRHARIFRDKRGMVVEDLNSTNGTFVNGKRVEGAVVIQPGDSVMLGAYSLTLTPDGTVQQRDFRGHMVIQARGVSLDVPGKRLLEQVSLTIVPTEFVGLMGPSGAGKTTLMNALNGYTPPAEGVVTINGQDLYANYDQFRGQIGYVPQDDIMHGDLTVGQALFYTARLRLPSDFRNDDIRKRIASVLADLGLEGTEDVLIGSPEKKGISGGQRKRVNLAMELLTDPSILFLDEPTSGLSSEDALTVMKVLRKLADGGKTILMTIHQPSLEVYQQLDNLVIVSKDTGSSDPGRLAYYGPAYPDAIKFFNPGKYDNVPADVALSPDEVLRGLGQKKTDHWVQQYNGSRYQTDFVAKRAGKQIASHHHAPPKRGAANYVLQWLTLVKRCLSVKRKDTTNTAILLAQAPIIALLVVFVFGGKASEEMTDENWQSVAKSTSITVFLLALSGLWFGCSNAVREIVAEWAIYRRERMVNLKMPTYVGSKLTVLGGLCVLQCIVLLTIVHFGAGLRGPWLAMLLVLVLASLVGLAIGLVVSALVKTSEVAVALLPLILLPMVILGGVLQPLSDMGGPMKLCSQVMPSRWAFEGLLLLESAERDEWQLPAVPPVPSTGNGGEAESTLESPAPIDVAETYFPIDDQRTSTSASVFVMFAMLCLLIGATGFILRRRDIH